MIRKTILIFALFLTSSFGEEKIKFLRQFNFAVKAQNHLEGFAESIGKNDFSYHSLRYDISDALLTRCTDGTMAIEWLTQEVRDQNIGEGLWFSWIAAVQLTDANLKFDVFIDDIKRFEIISGREHNKRYSNPEGGILEFTTIELDQHNDAHGYMSLFVPKNWIRDNKQHKIKIVGEAAKSNTWIIIYKADDVISHLQNLARYETWLDVEIEHAENFSNLKFSAPVIYANKSYSVTAGSKTYSVTLLEKGDKAEGNLELTEMNILKKKFEVSDENSKLIDLPSLDQPSKYQKLLSKSLIVNEVVHENNLTNIFCKRIYKPNTVNNLLRLSQSKLSKGKIILMNSSHQDIAWMDSPEKCVIERDTMLLTPLYEKAMNSDPSYRFDVEDALMLKEYIQRHPDRKEGIKTLLQEGKLSCGASYIQPYEEMYSGESLVRQFYFGKKWLKKEFGYNSSVYWNVDVTGKLMQMPQILNKSGVDFMVISRFEKGIYNWYSPDGSFVTAYSPGHYADAFMPLHKNVFDAANYLAESSMFWEKYYSVNSPQNVIPVLSDWDMSPAKDYSHVINNWESINFIENEVGEKISFDLPKFKIQTADEFLKNFVNSASHIPRIEGERPPVWLYIHGPSHYEALKFSREADILLCAAEKFSVIDALLENSMVNYPTDKFNSAWESKIYPDHGWGGKEGDITDELFKRKFEFSHNLASQILAKSISSISSKVLTAEEKGTPVIIFNSLNWTRSGPVKFNIRFEKGEIKNLLVTDSEGNNLDVQISEVSRYSDKSIKETAISFIASDIPSIGYRTYYLRNSNKSIKYSSNPYESVYYKLAFTDGGLKSIFDKELEIELIDHSSFSAGEIFTMRSEGHGAGEFSDVQQPTMEGFDKTGNYNSKWTIVNNGPVFSTFKNRQKIRNAVVEQTIVLYKKLKRIDIDISLLNWEGVLYREFRMALPLKMDSGQVAYETAFGVAEVGKDEIDGAAGERYTTPCNEIHPRGIENWIGAYDDNFGVTLSSSVAVADYIDPTDKESDKTILQPILLASRKSCHSEGNDYLQTGDHHYSFSFTSHKSGWRNGFKLGKAANEKLFVVVHPKQYKEAFLPEKESFFSVDREHVIVSTIKKAEDDNSVVVRLYDISGKDNGIELRSKREIKYAFRTNLIEEGNDELVNSDHTIKLNLGKNSIETIKIKPSLSKYAMSKE